MKDNQTNQIPNVIHYCWFGRGKYQEMIKRCIATWQVHLKDYKFILWNEDNFSSEVPFYKYAFENKKWAYVSDYVRLKVLYDQGGIYLDTDMFFMKPIPASFLQHPCFFGTENSNLIGSAIIGTKPFNQFLEVCLNYYETMVDVEENAFKIPNTKIISKVFRERYEFQSQFDQKILFDDITVYPIHFFYPYPFNINKRLDKSFKDYATENTIAIHLWNGSWHNYNEFHLFRRREYFKGFLKMFKNVINNRVTSKEYYRKVVVSLKKSIRTNK